MNTKQRINYFLQQSMVLQIATSADGLPWICSVCFAYDADFNLYWFSRFDTRHSREIANNPNIAGAIALPFALGDKSQGLQFTGTAAVMQDKKGITTGLSFLQKRYAVTDERVAQMKMELFSQTIDYGLYCLRPHTIILHDKLQFPDSARRVYAIPGAK